MYQALVKLKQKILSDFWLLKDIVCLAKLKVWKSR